MRFTECAKHPVLDTSTAEEIGRVDSLVVDPVGHRVHAIRVAKHRGGSILPWSEIQAFGPDALTVAADSGFRDPTGPLDLAADVVGQLVLSDEGFELGVIEDVEFDPASGALQHLDLGARTIDAADLIGAGRYAVVVRHPDDLRDAQPSAR